MSRFTRNTLLALSVASGAVGAHAQTNLLSDGDFEAFTGQVASGGYTTIHAPGTLGAWTVGGDSVDLIRNAYGSIADVSVDLSGADAGSLSQSFMAQAGQSYTLSWDYFRNDGGTDLTVSFGGQNYVYTPPASVTTASLTVTALTSGLQTVSFAGGHSNQGPVLDNVSLVVTAVPEPETYAMLLAGLGAVGFVARRRGAEQR